MPATSPEAIKRKRDNLNKRKREKKAASAHKFDIPKLSNVVRRRLMPKIPEMSKSELRAMLTAAVINTGGVNGG